MPALHACICRHHETSGLSISVLNKEVLLISHTDCAGLLEKQSHAIIGRARRDSINMLQIQDMSCSYILV